MITPAAAPSASVVMIDGGLGTIGRGWSHPGCRHESHSNAMRNKTLSSALGRVLSNVRCLQLKEISVPEVVDVRETVTLTCSYDMGTHKLNSVKWYKDGREFFRYSPMMARSLIYFEVDGVTVDRNSTEQICNQFLCTIQLHQLNIRSGGEYRCEVSGDAPEFKLAHGVGNMTVAAALVAGSSGGGKELGARAARKRFSTD
ncbi:AGAP013433-PA-like protein [Anopheles sinensis]|uniref:AGAP013433-PA-like protein n=1 Tax=Anopheles sinensis TaxID=74873 RepID=A0A084VIT2_ANOSI|nr:AGAP013433-PA-like protein [Anopheles sinensis]